MLSSPIVYLDYYGTALALRELLPLYFAPVPSIYHYLHIARSKYEEIIRTNQVKIKKYFYILRPIMACMWVEKQNTMPPMEFDKLMTAQELDAVLLEEIKKLFIKKTAGLEIDIQPKSQFIIDFFKAKIDYFEDYLKNVKKEKTSDYEALNALFLKTLKEVWG